MTWAAWSYVPRSAELVPVMSRFLATAGYVPDPTALTWLLLRIVVAVLGQWEPQQHAIRAAWKDMLSKHI